MTIDDRGSATVELAVIVPAFLLIFAVLIMAGRIMLAHQAVDAVAFSAARAASAAKSRHTAQADAATAAKYGFESNSLDCSSTTVDTDTTGLTAPAGTAAQVTATVTCVVNLADLSIPGVPGSITITKTGRSAVDTYRERDR